MSRRTRTAGTALGIAILLGCGDHAASPAAPAQPELNLITIAPELGPPSGGTAVTLRGTGFEPGMTVTFDEIPATNVQVSNSIHLTAVAPAHESGYVSVIVKSADGRWSMLVKRYLYSDGTEDGCPGCWDY